MCLIHMIIVPDQAGSCCIASESDQLCVHCLSLQQCYVVQVRSLEAASYNPIRCDPPESPTFQLVMLCRTLHRPTLAELATLLAPGGVLLIHHFLEGNTHPTNPDAVLRHGELREMFHSELEIVLDEQRAIEDGRVLTFFVARRRPKEQ